MFYIRLLFLVFFVFSFQSVSSQEIRARVLDSGSKEPIPYVNVILSDQKGVVTNEEGFFSFLAEKDFRTIRISSLGYETLEIDPGGIKNEIILLTPASIELGEVYLSNQKLSAREIVQKALEEAPANYDTDLSKKRIFFRESNTNLVRQFDLLVDKSTFPGIDQNLMNKIIRELPQYSDSYKEMLADLYGNYDSQKLRIVKAANLHNPQSTQTLDQLTEHLETLFRSNLKEKSYLKIKSGWFGVKVSSDELEEGLAEDSAPIKEKTAEEHAKAYKEDQASLQKSMAAKTNRLLKGMFWKEDIVFDLFQKSNRYDFSLAGFTHLDYSAVFIIDFKPKGRRGDYKGRLYINTIDYGVHRLEYENVKPLKKFSLLGISTSDDVYRGKMIFFRDANEKYILSYLEQETGETFGIKRPLTIIEKNKHVRGRRKQNELDLDLKLKMSEVQKLQLVVYQNDKLNEPDFDALAEPGAFEYQKFKVYDPEFWQGYNIIEPNTAIKRFTAGKKEDPEL